MRFRKRSRISLLRNVGWPELDERVAHRDAIRLRVQRTARSADDAGRIGELIAHLAVKERGKQFAIGEVAGAAEDDEIEGFDLDEFVTPWLSLALFSALRNATRRIAAIRTAQRSRPLRRSCQPVPIGASLNNTSRSRAKFLISGSAAPPIARASGPIAPGDDRGVREAAPVERLELPGDAWRTACAAPRPASRRR